MSNVVMAQSGSLAQRRLPRLSMPPAAVAISAVWLLLLALAVVLQPWLPLPDPDRTDYGAIAAVPFSPGHLLGTDEIGRDILSRAVAGARISVVAGVGAVLVAVAIGGTLGVIAGYFGSWTNRIISAVLDVMLAFPSLIALIALSVFLPASLWTTIAGLGIVFAPAVARVARASTLSFRHREFVLAAQATGSRHFKIILREIVPNVTIPIVAYGMVMVAVAIVAEASLSFLGLGVPPPAASWGSMMGTGRAALTESPHIVLIPALFMFVTLLAINFIAEHFGKRFDIRESVL